MQQVIEGISFEEIIDKMKAFRNREGNLIRVVIDIIPQSRESSDKKPEEKPGKALQTLLNIKPRKARFNSTDLIRRERDKLDTRRIT
jgi:hypothetical protein